MEKGYKKYLPMVFRFLAPRIRSEKEIRDNLSEKMTARKEENIPYLLDQVIAFLKKQKLVDDLSFAKWWVEQRTSYQPKGRRLIIMELKQKGISADVINAIFMKENETQDELALAKKVLFAKLPRYSHLSREEILPKLQRLLLSRGFDYASIHRSIDEVLPKSV